MVCSVEVPDRITRVYEWYCLTALWVQHSKKIYWLLAVTCMSGWRWEGSAMWKVRALWTRELVSVCTEWLCYKHVSNIFSKTYTQLWLVWLDISKGGCGEKVWLVLSVCTGEVVIVCTEWLLYKLVGNIFKIYFLKPMMLWMAWLVTSDGGCGEKVWLTATWVLSACSLATNWTLVSYIFRKKIIFWQMSGVRGQCG